MAKELKALWQCPKCGAKLVTRNMSHSCGKFDLDALFARSEPHVYQLFRRFEALVQQTCGPLTVIPQKTRVVFQDRTRFAGATPRKSHLICHFIFMHRHDDTRFFKIEDIEGCFVHQVRIEREDQLDADFADWIREAHAEYGQQRRLRRGAG